MLPALLPSSSRSLRVAQRLVGLRSFASVPESAAPDGDAVSVG